MKPENFRVSNPSMKPEKKIKLTGYRRIDFGCLFPPHGHKYRDFAVATRAEPVYTQLNSSTGKHFLVTMAVML